MFQSVFVRVAPNVVPINIQYALRMANLLQTSTKLAHTKVKLSPNLQQTCPYKWKTFPKLSQNLPIFWASFPKTFPNNGKLALFCMKSANFPIYGKVYGKLSQFRGKVLGKFAASLPCTCICLSKFAEITLFVVVLFVLCMMCACCVSIVGSFEQTEQVTTHERPWVSYE